jgi:hypothetical protein
MKPEPAKQFYRPYYTPIYESEFPGSEEELTSSSESESEEEQTIDNENATPLGLQPSELSEIARTNGNRIAEVVQYMVRPSK